MPVQGKNSEILHAGQRYHVQTESWEPQEKAIVSQVFSSGKVVLKKTHRIDKSHSYTEEDIEKAHEDMMSSLKGMLL